MLVFDSGLAPEQPFPEGLNDSVAAYHYLLTEGVEPANIAFMGDSGGGCLCFATLFALEEKGVPLPAAAVVLSPRGRDLCLHPDTLGQSVNVARTLPEFGSDE